MQDGSVPTMPDVLADAVVPRGATVLVALGLLAVLVVFAGSFGRAVIAAVRGPPCTPRTVLSGRQILARFCIARR